MQLFDCQRRNKNTKSYVKYCALEHQVTNLIKTVDTLIRNNFHSYVQRCASLDKRVQLVTSSRPLQSSNPYYDFLVFPVQ